MADGKWVMTEEGFGYKSFKCRTCGGTTDFVYKDEAGRFFK